MADQVVTNRFIDGPTADDIDRPIARLLRDLDDPEPPLRLELVREQLKLDRQYYSSSDDGVLRETIHRLRIGARQVVRRPALLLDVVRRRQLRALWVPDRRRILIDKELPSAKRRWGEAHEIGHSLIPWHEALAHGDERRTLSPTCEEQIEAEANYAAGRLLFLQGAFVERVRSSPAGFLLVQDLAKEFANTLTSTLWRTVESLDEPAFGLIGQHPRRDMIAATEPLIQYFVRSRPFLRSFAGASPVRIYDQLGGFCFGRRGPIGRGELLLTDEIGQDHTFTVESFFNGYQALTFGVRHTTRAIIIRSA